MLSAADCVGAALLTLWQCRLASAVGVLMATADCWLYTLLRADQVDVALSAALPADSCPSSKQAIASRLIWVQALLCYVMPCSRVVAG
jgi:hypothetical protein